MVQISTDSTGFVSLGEYIPDVLLDIRYYSTFNFIGERIDGYEAPEAYMTKEAASALQKVSDAVMKKGYRLKIFDAYRSQRAVDHFMRWAKDEKDIRMKEYFYPLVDKKNLIPEGYIAEHSGHSRGSTVDLTLFDMQTQRDMDMGGTFDYFGEISHSDYLNLTKEQYHNRILLKEVMMEYGFLLLYRYRV